MSALLGRWAPCSNCRLCRFFSLSLFSDATAAAANDDFHMPSHRPYFFDWKTRRNQLMVYTRTPSYILQTEVERSRRTNEYKGYIFFFCFFFLAERGAHVRESTHMQRACAYEECIS